MVGWDRFQHYKDRDVLWVKNYTRLMDDDAYLALTPHCTAILHRLWLVYAKSRCELRNDTAMLSRRLSLKVTTTHLRLLNQAGFIAFVASKSLAERYHDRTPHVLAERREEKSKPSAVVEGPIEADGENPEDDSVQQTDQDSLSAKSTKNGNADLDRLLPLPAERIAELDRLAAQVGRDLP